MKIWKKMIAGAVALSMVAMTACTSGSEGAQDASAEGEGGAKGRYLESEISLPDEIGYGYDMERMSDGTLRMLTASGIYDSKDDGATWEMSDILPGVYQEMQEETAYIDGAAIDKEGNMFFSATDMDTYMTKYIYVAADGTETEVPVELPAGEDDMDWGAAMSDEELQSMFGDMGESEETEGQPDTEEGEVVLSEGERAAYLELYNNMTAPSLSKIRFAADGNIFGGTYSGDLYYVDAKSGEIKNTYGASDDYKSIYDFAQLGEKLYAATESGMEIYNLEDGSQEPVDDALKDYFGSGQEADDSVGHSPVQAEILLVPGEDEDTFYFADRAGLHRYTKGSSEIELIINGELTSMSNQQVYMLKLLSNDDGSFLTLNEGDSQGKPKLLNYVYSEDASATPGKELQVYALQDSQNIRQAISLFQSQNPDYYVNLEVGMTGDDAVTASDALRTLNTSIMAGNGPDILILDGMPVDSYIEKDLLVDLSEVAAEAEGNSSYFENILNANKTEDGLYAMPTRFLIPVIYGEPDALNSSSDLQKLADTMEKLDAEKEGGSGVWSPYTAAKLVKIMLYGSADAITNEDGTINEDTLKGFLEQVKRIYDIGQKSVTEEEEEINTGGSANAGSIQDNIFEMLSHSYRMDAGSIGSIQDINTLLSILEENEWDYQMFNGMSEGNFISVDAVGISAKSERIEDSKEFVKALFTEELQKIAVSDGFPVSTDAYTALWEESVANKDTMKSTYSIVSKDDETGEVSMIELDIEPQSAEDYEKFKEQFESLSASADIGDVIEEAVVNGVSSYINGDESLEDAVDSVIQAVNIYLAE